MNTKPLPLILACLAMAQSSFAVTTLADDVLVGINGKVVIGEYGDGTVFGQPAHYYVDVLPSSGAAINGFAVSTFAGAYPITPRAGWGAIGLTQSDWDLGQAIGSGGLTTLDLGLFASLFGDAPAANLYFNWGGDSGGLDLVDALDSNQDQDGAGAWSDEFWNNDNNQFWFSAAVTSDFVAFDANGTVVDKSRTTPVPDAGSTLTLSSVMLAALTAATRRWRM